METINNLDDDGFVKGARPICVFCNAPWTAENIKVWDVDSADQCSSGRFGPPTYSISITCHACKREMYRKEGAKAPYG